MFTWNEQRINDLAYDIAKVLYQPGLNDWNAWLWIEEDRDGSMDLNYSLKETTRMPDTNQWPEGTLLVLPTWEEIPNANEYTVIEARSMIEHQIINNPTDFLAGVIE